jgi:hypothetical protein
MVSENSESAEGPVSMKGDKLVYDLRQRGHGRDSFSSRAPLHLVHPTQETTSLLQLGYERRLGRNMLRKEYNWG